VEVVDRRLPLLDAAEDGSAQAIPPSHGRPPTQGAFVASTQEETTPVVAYDQEKEAAVVCLHLACSFGNTERFWINLQARYDLETAKDRLGDRLGREVTATAH
jgi:hypothetical protein